MSPQAPLNKPMTQAAPPTALRFTTAALAERLGAELVGPPDLVLTRVDGLEKSDESTLTFIRDARHAARWSESRAGAAIVSRAAVPPGHDATKRAILIVDDADLAIVSLLEDLAPAHAGPRAGRHPSCAVDPSAEVDPSASLGAGVVIGPGARVGARSVLHANVVLGAGVRVGAECDLRAGVVVEDRCVIADRVIIHPNAVIGADGFGYRPAPRSDAGGPALLKVPHAGNVVVESDVEIGACTTVDRAKFGATVVGMGSKIDNLVQIGHNCVIGRNCVICGATGLAGSVTLGDGVTIGGGVGVKDGLIIGAGATIAARAAVMDDVPARETWVGYPARPAKETMRIVAATMKLPDVLKEMRTAQRAARGDGA